MTVLLVAFAGGQTVAAAPGDVTYQVLLPNGKPAVGAKVLIRSKSPHPERTLRAVTKTDGTFVAPNLLHLLRQASEDFLVVDAPGHALGFWSRVEPGKPLRLLPAYTARGKVVTPDDRPVGGALVVVTVAGNNLLVPVTFINRSNLDQLIVPQLATKSATDGTFVLRGATHNGERWHIAGTSVWASAALGGRLWLGNVRTFFTKQPANRFVGRKPDPVDDLSGEAHITLRPTATIAGQIINTVTEQPVADASVTLQTLTPISRDLSQTTDAQGRFQFENVPGLSPRTLHIFHRELQRTDLMVRENQVDANREAIQNLRIRLRPSVEVSGRVLDEDTAEPPPVDNLSVSIGYHEDMGNGWAASSFAGKVLHPGDTFTLSAPSGPVGVFISAPHGPRSIPPYDTKFELNLPPEGLKDFTFKARKQIGFLVRFEGERGKPAGVQVYRRTQTGEVLINVSTYTYNAGEKVLGWFYPAQQWGEKMQIRGATYDKEVFAWLEIVADPKQWPIIIKIP